MVISDIVGRSVLDFIDYSLVVVSVMILWYGIKLFLVGTKPSTEDEEKTKELREFVTGKVKGAIKKAEHQASHEKRHTLIDRVRGWLLYVHHGADEVYDILLRDKGEEPLEEAKKKIEKMEADLTRARRRLHLAHLHVKGAQRDLLADLYTRSQVILEKTIELKGKLPTADMAPDVWEGKVAAIKPIVTTITGACGALTLEIEKFIDKGVENSD
jgi:hypothetical protein